MVCFVSSLAARPDGSAGSAERAGVQVGSIVEAVGGTPGNSTLPLQHLCRQHSYWLLLPLPFVVAVFCRCCDCLLWFL